MNAECVPGTVREPGDLVKWKSERGQLSVFEGKIYVYLCGAESTGMGFGTTLMVVLYNIQM